MSLESKIKEIANEYGYVTTSVREDKFKIKTGNYHPEETYTYDYETEYYSTLLKAVDAYLKGDKKVVEYWD